MPSNPNSFERGSEWRQWDLHIHTPASFHWAGKNFSDDFSSRDNFDLIDDMISALNKSKPAVFALMDYWTFDGWFALKNRLSEPNSPKLDKTIFPGIELRLVSPMQRRLNAHVIFSNKASDQTLNDFVSQLRVEIVDRPLSKDSLIALARTVGRDKLESHNFNKDEVDSKDEKALLAGSTVAEINCDSYKNAISSVQEGLAVGFMPWDTNDGLADIKWQEHYAYCLGLFKSSPIFETRNIDYWAAFAGEETDGNSDWLSNFQKALDNIPRLAVCGSDAHQFIGKGDDNDNRGYGDFPSNKPTWIKADPSFEGLLQAIKEPAKRSYIGSRPDKLSEIDQNKTYFIDSVSINIDSVSINKCLAPKKVGAWLDGCKLLLNPDLVAIIGNKGSGKSALADVIALLGNSRQTEHFSFLKKNRFRGKSGDPAKHFKGSLVWKGSFTDSKDSKNLDVDPNKEDVELVRYIPQGHFEELCNDHVTNKSDLFENELRSVIFSHADESVRLGALDFDQIIEKQEASLRAQLEEYRKDLRKVNQKVCSAEDQLQPSVRKALDAQLSFKKYQIEEHEKIKPTVVPKPSSELKAEQQDATKKLQEISIKLKEIEESIRVNTTTSSTNVNKLQGIKTIEERVGLLDRSFSQTHDEIRSELTTLGIKFKDIATLKIDLGPLDSKKSAIQSEQEKIADLLEKLEISKKKLTADQNQLNAKLDLPQQQYQNYLKTLENWRIKSNELVGSSDSPDTLEGYKKRLMQLDKLPEERKGLLKQRGSLTGDIFDVLDTQRIAREKLFHPLQKLIQKNSLIREEYKLQFRATLDGSVESITELLFLMIKQNIGDFRGEDESLSTVEAIMDKFDFSSRSDILNFVDELHDKLSETAGESFGIDTLLRKDRKAAEVYDLIFGLSFLKPRYSLLFQDTQIEQLSPGQRGALLLIFYLLVDKGTNPIVLDQPEENLDNETIVSLLVPVLNEAKKKRQVIMVTHNPNLAVVCDAEQIIYSEFNRTDSNRISYESGSIENPITNRHVVNVLEGTMPAFNNRKSKYQK